MKIFKSKWFGIGLIVFSAVSSYFLLQWGAKITVVDFLNRKIPNNISFAYEELKVDFLNGDLLFLNPEIEIRHNATEAEQLTVDLNEIRIEDIHYWRLFYHKEITVSKILINEPDFIFLKREHQKEKQDKIIKLLKPIYVEDLVVENGSVRIIEEDSLEVLRLDSLYVNLNGGRTNVSIVNKKIPFEYNTVEVDLKNFSALLGKYEKIEADGFKLNNTEIILRNTHVFTKVSKRELSQEIPYERDHLNIEIKETIITDFDFNFDRDSLLVTADSGDVSGLKLEIFRDKNPPDDIRNKFLYAKMLKSLPFHIAIETFNISDSNLVYEEEEEKKKTLVSFGSKIFLDKLGIFPISPVRKMKCILF
ncbi:hypothetical protein [Maribacter aestuarii]|uniref:hypothetical protein n=1 Tax=Maribacter aestuarii TaxID=1130723 RepID=UPI0025A52684|nr:hypothetical protein [Maribacter aestuarii]